MKVAILTRDYPPAIGGIATHVERLVVALRRLGVDADLYVGYNDVKTLLLPFDMPLKDYDLIHVQSLPYGAFVFGVPLVVTVHSPVLEEFAHYRSSLKVAAIPAVALEKVSLSRASEILAVSEQSRSDLARQYGIDAEKIEVIGNGVDFARFSHPRDATEGHARTRVLVVSRLEARKNIREAIEAVVALPQGSCNLDIVGEGSERPMLESLVKSAGASSFVSFLGRVDKDDLPDIYGSSDIFLTTSTSEGFGLSLLEAMSSGCACVASDLPAHRALIEQGVTGQLYESKSELVSSLLGLLSSPHKVARLGLAAQAAASGHTWDKVAEKVAAAYASALSMVP